MSGLNSKIIVLGSTGMLGRYMYNYMKHVHGSRCIGVNRQHFDARDLSEDYFKGLICKGTVVINCVGIVKPYISAVGQIDTIKINSIFPQMIANVCLVKSAKFIQICSDCVFSGRKGSYIWQTRPSPMGADATDARAAGGGGPRAGKSDAARPGEPDATQA